MENEYIIIKGGLAFTVFIVSVDLAYGRYQIFSTALNNVHHEVYETIADAEKVFQDWLKVGRIDAWAKKWNVNMPPISY